MAVKNPAVRGDTGFIPPSLGVFGGQIAQTEVLSTAGSARSNRQAFRLSIHYFADIDDADTWDDAPPGVIACAWQADDVSADHVACFPTGDKQITFDAGAADNAGWVWVLSARTT